MTPYSFAALFIVEADTGEPSIVELGKTPEAVRRANEIRAQRGQKPESAGWFLPQLKTR